MGFREFRGIFTDLHDGLAPLSGGGTANFLRADATYAVPAGTYVHPNHSGDATSVGDGAITFATVNANVGSFGLAASVAQFTVNAKGLITAAANVAIAIAAAAITDSTVAGRAMLTAASTTAQTALLDLVGAAKGLMSAADKTKLDGIAAGANNYVHPNHTGDATSVGDGATTLATVNANVGSFGLAASVAQFTVNAKGLITTAANVAIAIAAAAITDATAAGRNMLTAASTAAQTALLDVATGALKGLMSAADKTKLDGITTGTYTPTLTAVTNVAASGAFACQYMRVGSVVTVSGKLTVDPTAAAATELGIELPIASAFATEQQCGGTAYSLGIASEGAGIVADATNDRATMKWVAASAVNRTMAFSFTYLIV